MLCLLCGNPVSEFWASLGEVMCETCRHHAWWLHREAWVARWFGSLDPFPELVSVLRGKAEVIQGHVSLEKQERLGLAGRVELADWYVAELLRLRPRILEDTSYLSVPWWQYVMACLREDLPDLLAEERAQDGVLWPCRDTELMQHALEQRFGLDHWTSWLALGGVWPLALSLYYDIVGEIGGRVHEGRIRELSEEAGA
jgi:hypothetical protein